MSPASSSPSTGRRPSTDANGWYDPANWLEFAIDQVELVQNWLYGSGDGGYGEGPYYQRYGDQNLLPFLRAWDRLTDGRATVIGGRAIPSLYRDPSFRATQRWMLDMTLPDGSLAPVDDGNVGFTQYFGALAQDDPNAAAFVWRWANAVNPYDSDGSISLAADEIVAYDDAAVSPAPPAGSPTRFYPEAGDAIFRSDWGPDAVESVVLGEHGAASELGRDRDGLGRVASAAHEHPDSGSFLLHAFGERLLLDPGYMTFPTRGDVNKATDHNLVLVDGAGPDDPFPASIAWFGDPAGSPKVAGTGDGLGHLRHGLPRRRPGHEPLRRDGGARRRRVAPVPLRRRPLPRRGRHPHRRARADQRVLVVAPRQRGWDERRDLHARADRR